MARALRKTIRKKRSRRTHVFGTESFISTTEIGRTEFLYNKINLLAETGSYFVFVYDKSHAQVYDRRRLSGGTDEEFCRFIADKTGKEIIKIKKVVKMIGIALLALVIIIGILFLPSSIGSNRL